MNPKSTAQTSALKVNVCENTARKYLQKENWLPSEIIAECPLRQYLTRQSPFDDIYDEIDERLRAESEEGKFVLKKSNSRKLLRIFSSRLKEKSLIFIR